MKKVIIVFGLLCLAGFLSHGNASTLAFNYVGYQETLGIAGTGTGSFSFADNLTSIGLSDLTSFSFAEMQDATACGPCHEGDPNYPNIRTFTFGLADLTSFSVQLQGGAPVNFAFSTDDVNGQFQAFTAYDPPGIGVIGGFGDAVGPVTFSPEPATTGMAGVALVAFALARRKSSRANA